MSLKRESLFEGGGAGSMGTKGNMPLTPLQASGSANLRDGDQYWGQIVGTVTKRAARIRVPFDMGIPHWSWKRSRPATATRSTSTPASTAYPPRTSGRPPGRSSG